MKNHRFLWLRNRTTNNRKCEKARNIKEKRTIEMFSTVSRPHVALRSSASADIFQYRFQKPEIHWIPGFSLSAQGAGDRIFARTGLTNRGRCGTLCMVSYI